MKKSEKNVLLVLKSKKKSTPFEISKEVRFSVRTIRHALASLVKNGLVLKVPSLEDTRRFIYVYVGE